MVKIYPQFNSRDKLQKHGLLWNTHAWTKSHTRFKVGGKYTSMDMYKTHKHGQKATQALKWDVNTQAWMSVQHTCIDKKPHKV